MKAKIIGFMLCCALIMQAKITLQPMFSNNMVLQQRTDAPVWGGAIPNGSVRITTSWNKKTYTVVADGQGKWTAKVATPAAGGPYSITISDSDGEPVILEDVLIGEVWLCTGQSNMEMPMEGWNIKTNAAEIAASGRYKNIRLLRVEQALNATPQTAVKARHGGWTHCSPETVHDFSATAYFFGRHLYQDRHVPIGLIMTCWGGTPIEAWIGQESLRTKPEFKTLPAVTNTDNPCIPTVLFNGMIQPLVPYAVKGAIWYQGESNAPRAYQYRELLPLMIHDWRTRWGCDFPFYIAQLANYMHRKAQPMESEWAELREAQLKALSVKNTGMAVLIDVGMAEDIHPIDKQTVGDRLGMAARATAYGEKIAYSGPIYERHQLEGNKIRLFFKHTDKGLRAHDGQPLKGFAVAGLDHVFHWATAHIDGSTVVVESLDVALPIAVRYAWVDNPECNLYNGVGLPASPFRTDDWQGITYGRK